MAKRIKFSVKMKILGLLVSLLTLSIGAYVYFALDLFSKDKTNYIFESSLSRTESLSQQFISTIKHATVSSYSLALMANINDEQLQGLINLDKDILIFLILNKDKETGEYTEKNRAVNETLLKGLEDSYKVDTKLIKSIDYHGLLKDDLLTRGEINVYNTTNQVGTPTITIYSYNPREDEYYLTVLDITSFLDQIKKDTVYTNILLDKNGQSYIKTEEKFSRESYIQEILETKIQQGTKQVVDSKGIEKLVAFSKIDGLNMVIITEITSNKAFSAAASLVNKSLFFGVLLIGVSVFVGVLFSVSITKPIKKLLAGTRYVAKGEFDKKIRVQTRDEIGVLAKSFNFMSSEISNLLKNKELMINELNLAKEKLEDYSKNLEKMVEQRTAELKKANDFLDAMINSLGQGLMVFNQDSICNDVYTKACEDLFGVVPAGKDVSEVLDITDKNSFDVWRKSLFEERIPFEHLIPLGPKAKVIGDSYKDENYRYVGLEYFPMRNEQEQVENVVTVATDKTAEMVASASFKEQEAQVSMIMKMINNKKQFISFITEFKKLMKDLESYVMDEEINIDGILIALHSIKGGASLYSINSIQTLAHECESEVIRVKKEGDEAFQEFLPKLKEYLEELYNAFSLFLVESRKILGGSMDESNPIVEVEFNAIKRFKQDLENIANPELVKEYENIFIKEPIVNNFTAYNDLIISLADRLGKDVYPLKFEGGSFRVTPEVYDEFFNVLVHVFRNSMDHGIEAPSTRKEKGKDRKGSIQVEFIKEEREQGAFLTVKISDDGKGIDPSVIRDKVGEKAVQESDEEVIYHIFDPEFSTAEAVTDLSGRGVGMSAIKEIVEERGGDLKIESVVGEGTTFIFSIPLVDL